MDCQRWLIVGLLLANMQSLQANTISERFVFGSFSIKQNATNWAQRVSARLGVSTQVSPVLRDQQTWYRVVTAPVPTKHRAAIVATAKELDWPFWSMQSSLPAADTLVQSSHVPLLAGSGSLPVLANPDKTTADTGTTALGPLAATSPMAADQTQTQPAPLALRPTSEGHQRPPTAVSNRTPRGPTSSLDWDLGFQSRGYAHAGLAGQTQQQMSASVQLDFERSWRNDRHRLRVSPFARIDGQDNNRTHADMRELYWSMLGNDWEIHAGLRRVFWGVTEFHHLVDVINQTDLVENPDMEDKLGQPTVTLSLVRDWGIVDLMLLPGFRERTFASRDGRLRAALPVDEDDASYASAAKNQRVDGAVRWSHQFGSLDFALYHFSGTNRDPQFKLQQASGGAWRLSPHYTTIDQSGLEAQYLIGDWALKVEAITRSGDADRYAAANVGFERTLVGFAGTRADLGVVVEYMWDERGRAATNNLFERDLAVGTRWQLNDAADTQALVGLIWDTQSEEYTIALEASRRLGELWRVELEGRAFGGSRDPRGVSELALLADAEHKNAVLERDDFLQLELTRYF